MDKVFNQTPDRDDRGRLPLTLRVHPAFALSDEQFFQLCQQNRELHIERTAQGDWIFMPPTGGESGDRESELNLQVRSWAKQDDTGNAFSASTGFNLPNGATRSPDAAWVLRSRLATLTPEQKRKFLPLCPDFVAEVRSPSDSLRELQDKLQEYLDNGARLGLLLDPPNRHVYVYRPEVATQRLNDPAIVACDPELPGFVLDVQAIFNPNF